MIKILITAGVVLGLLLCLVLADLFRAKQIQKNWHTAWESLWSEEHFFVIQNAPERRLMLGQWCFLLSTAFYVEWAILCRLSVTRWYFGLPLYLPALIFAIIKILFLTKYSYKKLLIACLWLCVPVITYALTQEPEMVALLLLLLAAKDVKMRPVFQASVFLSGITWLCAAAAATIFAWLPLTYLDREEALFEKRWGMGFAHPNYAGFILAFVLAGAFLLHYGRWKWYDWTLQAAGLAALFALTGSRASIVLVLLTWVSTVVLYRFPKFAQSKGLRYSMASLPVVLTGVSFALALCYTKESALMRRLNGFSSGRLYLWNKACKEYSFTVTPWTEHIDESFALDNTYLTLFYKAGFIVFLLFLIAMTVLLYKLLKEKHYGEAACVVAVLCYSVLEKLGALLPCNIGLWLLPALVWNAPFSLLSPQPGKTEEPPKIGEGG